MKKKQIFIFLSVIIAMLIIAFLFKSNIKQFFGILTPHGILTSHDKVYNYTDYLNANTIYIDFENDKYDKNQLYKKIAHSGQYSSKVFGKNSFSIVIEKAAQEIGIENLTKASLSAWIYVFPHTNELKFAYVFSITDKNNHGILWKAVGINKKHKIKSGKWFKVSGNFNLKDIKILPDYKIQVYVWNNSNTKILTDDFFVVFGNEKHERGKTVLCDLTKDTLPKANIKSNFPPFNTVYFHKTEINNNNVVSFINNSDNPKQKNEEITPDSRIIKGNFFKDKNNLDKIICFKSSKQSIYVFCDKYKKFQKISIINDKNQIYWNYKNIVVGDFDGDAFDEILFVGNKDKATYLAKFQAFDFSCNKNQNQQKIYLRYIWKSKKINEQIINNNDRFYPVKLNSDEKTKLLIISDDGKWNLLNFDEKSWLSLAKNQNNQWDNKNFDTKIIVSKFLKHYPFDVILTICKDKNNKKYHYNILKYNVLQKNFISCFKNNPDSEGIVFGLDTLKTTDDFIIGNFYSHKPTQVLRYNRDWRFDLKLIEFNDSTYNIKANIDFAEYKKDYNPKYYEILKIYSGKFISHNYFSLLTIMRNCKDKNFDGKNCKQYINLDYLPNALDIYSAR